MILAKELGITAVVLPEFDKMLATPQRHKHHQYDVGVHCIKAVEHVHAAAKEQGIGEKEYSILSWSALLHDVGKPSCLTLDEDGTTHFYGHPAVGKEMARKILRRLRFDNYTIDLACRLIQYHDVTFSEKKGKMRKLMNTIGIEWMPYLFLLMQGDILSQSMYQREEKLATLACAKKLYQEVLDAKECVNLKMLAVNGSDLLKDGFQKGKNMGEILQYLLDYVIENPEKNEKQILLQIANEKFNHYKN